MMIISFIGFMGCGKSSVGRRLSQLLCCPFIDLDQVIEERAGRTIPEIFARDGERAFRQRELEALKSVVYSASHDAKIATIQSSEPRQATRMVVASGGGVVMTPGCAEILQAETMCIYLRASIDTLIEHLEGQTEGRPMLQGAELRERIERLMGERSDTYEANAHMIIDIDGKNIDEIGAEIADSILYLQSNQINEL